MNYMFRGPGARRDIPADVVGTELQRIYDAQGELTPPAIVEESRPPTATLHPVFEWDDAAAAEQYRQAQARQLVRAVVLVPDPRKGEGTPTIRAFVSVSKPDEPLHRTYKPTIEALQNPLDAAALKARMLRELLSMRQRYIDLVDFDEQINARFQQLVEVATG